MKDIYENDSAGHEAPLDLIGRKVRHFKGTEYEVMGYAFDATNDLWIILYTRLGDIIYSRSVSNFVEDVDGQPRFEVIG